MRLRTPRSPERHGRRPPLRCARPVRPGHTARGVPGPQEPSPDFTGFLGPCRIRQAQDQATRSVGMALRPFRGSCPMPGIERRTCADESREGGDMARHTTVDPGHRCTALDPSLPLGRRTSNDGVLPLGQEVRIEVASAEGEPNAGLGEPGEPAPDDQAFGKDRVGVGQVHPERLEGTR